MIERVAARPWLWPAALLAVVAAALLLSDAAGSWLQVANPDPARATEVTAALDGLPDDAMVLVGMDPDLGTYPEIRATVRAALSELLERGARIAFVSYTPEGRAAAAAEVERLIAGGADAGRVLDLGFVAGAEAGLVLSVTQFGAAGASFPAAFADAAAGIAAFDMTLVVGGLDIGPRTWVEQVVTRVPDMPVLAVVPTFLQPEVAPYLRTGQLAGLLATVRDGATFASGVGDGEAQPAALPMLAGMLVALGVIGRALYVVRRPDATPGRREPDEQA
ncbi:MAG TPA: hypothetical protein VHK63_00465 [Candidatus Limnocylindria bacterium]|nr:hypothetical protein [Candidatus Limnocylindria bacterium]